MTSYAPRARRRRWPLALAITLLVLIGLAVAVDRIAVVVAESAVARTVQNSQNLAQKPDVSIAGFPFLTQVARGKFGKIELTDDDIVVGQSGRTVRLDHLKLTLHNVDVARDFKSATAASGTAAARMTYPALSQAVGTPVSYAGSGRIKATASVNLGGQHISGTVTAEPRLSGSSLEFVSQQVTVNGATAPAAVAAELGQVFGAPISFDDLPYSLRVEQAGADKNGVEVTLSARGLTFRR